MKKYLCTISYRDAPDKYAMENGVVEEIGKPGDHGETWVRVVGTGEEFRAYKNELWPISDQLAIVIIGSGQGQEAKEPGF